MIKEIQRQAALRIINEGVKAQRIDEKASLVMKQNIEEFNQGRYTGSLHMEKYKQLDTSFVMFMGVGVDNSFISKRSDKTEIAIEGANKAIDILKSNSHKENIFLKTKLLSEETPVNNWVKVEQAEYLSAKSFKKRANIPLFDEVVDLITSGTLEREKAIGNGKTTAMSVLIFSDGTSRGSRTSLRQLREIVSGSLRKNPHDRVTYIGLPEGEQGWHLDRAKDMGIEEKKKNNSGYIVSDVFVPKKIGEVAEYLGGSK